MANELSPSHSATMRELENTRAENKRLRDQLEHLRDSAIRLVEQTTAILEDTLSKNGEVDKESSQLIG